MTTPTKAQRAVQHRWSEEEFQKKLEKAFWVNHPVVARYQHRLATGDPDCDWLTWFIRECLPRDKKLEVAVLGCGEGWLERSIASFPWIGRIHASDVAVGAVERSRRRAAEAGLENISYSVLDLNKDQLPAKAFDVVIAHSVLHHIDDLENAFSTIRSSLRPGGVMAVLEYVGEPHVQYTDEALEVIHQVLQCLDPRLRTHMFFGHVIDAKPRPDLDYMLETDPSEGVRSHHLDQLIRRNFSVASEADMGGTLLSHLLWEIVGNFQADNAVDNCLLELICLLEQMLIEASHLASDYRLYICHQRDRGPTQEPFAITNLRLGPVEKSEGESTPNRVVPAVNPEWRGTNDAKEHFQILASGHPGGDWLTDVVQSLELEGFSSDSKVLWLGGSSWAKAALDRHYKSVTEFSWPLLLSWRVWTDASRFDLAFADGIPLFGTGSRRVAAASLLLRRSGVLALAEPDVRPHPLRTEWLRRLSEPISRLLGVAEIPAQEAGSVSEEEKECDDISTRLFQHMDTRPLGGDLLNPLMDLFWERLPVDRRQEVLRLIGVAERVGLGARLFPSAERRIILSTPRRSAALKSLLLGAGRR